MWEGEPLKIRRVCCYLASRKGIFNYFQLGGMLGIPCGGRTTPLSGSPTGFLQMSTSLFAATQMKVLNIQRVNETKEKIII